MKQAVIFFLYFLFVNACALQGEDFKYDSEGRVSAIIKPDGTEIHRMYDSEKNLVEYFADDGTVHYKFAYDALNRLIKIGDMITGTEAFRSYDDEDRIVSERLGNDLEISFQYDHEGRLTALLLPDGTSVSYSYEADRLKSIEKFDQQQQLLYKHEYSEFDAEGNVLSSRMVGNGGEINFAYDEEIRYQQIISGHWSEIIPQNGYDAMGNLQEFTVTDPNGAVHSSFAYDEQNRLICDRLDGNARNLYDANGNRILKQTDDETIIYRYDALDRLIDVEKSDGCQVHYTYDPFFRRLTKTCTKDGCSRTVRFLYDGNREIGAADEQGNIMELRVLGIGLGAEIGAAIALELHGRVFAPVHDHRGNVVCLVDAETGEVEEFYRFDPYGCEQCFTQGEAPLNPWRFSSKRYDEESRLIDYGKRYYDPESGRWLTMDPLGSVDGEDLYCFLRNNPLTHIDLYGLYSIKHGMQSFWKTGKKVYDSLVKFAYDMSDVVVNDLRFTSYIKSGLEDFYIQIFGKNFLQFAGYYESQPIYGTLGQDELDEKVKITFINGILNVKEQFLANLQYLSEMHGGNKVHYVFRPTEGWTLDVFNCFLIKMGLLSANARMIASTWKNLIEEMGGVEGGGKIIHYAHSIGATDTYKAKDLLTPEEQKMIHVITLGSPTMIPNEGFANVSNYVSIRDGVCLLDPIGFFGGLFDSKGNVVYLGSLQGIPIIDHPLFMKTYIDAIQMLGEQFLKMLESRFRVQEGRPNPEWICSN